MEMPPPRFVRNLERVAELRANGQTWHQVGRVFRRTGEAVRGWTKRYPEFWAKALAEARRDTMTEARDEGLNVLRKLVRSDSETIQRDASSKLVSLPAPDESQGTTPEELIQFVLFLEGLSDDELESFMSEDDAEDQARAASSDPDAANPPSAA